MERVHVNVLVWCVLITCLNALCSHGVWAQMSSSNYRLEPVVFGASGGESSSVNYTHGGSFGQPMTVGTSSSPKYIVQSGFWSFAGSGLVPVLLQVSKNPTNSDIIRLEWSGNNPPYQIYRAGDCSQVFNAYLTSTTAQVYDDTTSPPGLSCYNVLATAPGIRSQKRQ